jgi:hypothetical protein
VVVLCSFEVMIASNLTEHTWRTVVTMVTTVH